MQPACALKLSSTLFSGDDNRNRKTHTMLGCVYMFRLPMLKDIDEVAIGCISFSH